MSRRTGTVCVNQSGFHRMERRAIGDRLPKCVCGHSKAHHESYGTEGVTGCSVCPLTLGCRKYRPVRVSVRRSAPVARKAEAPKRKTRIRKKRKGKRASIARECDRLWSLIVRSRGASEISGKTEGLQGAHGFSRSYKSTRWLPINGFALTQAEHVYYTYRPLEWDEYLRKSWGQLTYDELRRRAINNVKQDMPAVLAALQAEARYRGVE